MSLHDFFYVDSNIPFMRHKHLESNLVIFKFNNYVYF